MICQKCKQDLDMLLFTDRGVMCRDCKHGVAVPRPFPESPIARGWRLDPEDAIQERWSLLAWLLFFGAIAFVKLIDFGRWLRRGFRRFRPINPKTEGNHDLNH